MERATTLPRVDASQLGPTLGPVLDDARDRADKIGVTADIEHLTYKGYAAEVIARILDSRLEPWKRLTPSDQDHGAGNPVAFVRRVQMSLGARGIEHDAEIHAAWKRQVELRLEQSMPFSYPKLDKQLRIDETDAVAAYKVSQDRTSEIPRTPERARVTEIDHDSTASERQVAGEIYKHANAALGEIVAREPKSMQEAERIVDGHVAQQRAARPGARPTPARTGGERLRSYVQDKFDEIGAGKGSPRDLRPVSGRVVAVTDRAVRIARNDKSIAEVDRTKLPHVPAIGERVMVTYDGAGNAALRTLPERAQDKAMGRELAR